MWQPIRGHQCDHGARNWESWVLNVSTRPRGLSECGLCAGSPLHGVLPAQRYAYMQPNGKNDPLPWAAFLCMVVGKWLNTIQWSYQWMCQDKLSLLSIATKISNSQSKLSIREWPHNLKGCHEQQNDSFIKERPIKHSIFYFLKSVAVNKHFKN